MSLLRHRGLMLGGSGDDPYWANVVSLLHFDGPNLSTTFVDQVPGVTWSVEMSGAQIRTAESKFGGSSGYFTGAPSSIQCGQKTVGSFGNRDFTVEGWLFPTSYPSAAGRYWFAITRDNAGASQRGWQINISGDNANCLSASIYLNGVTPAAVTITSLAPPPLNTWTHVALVRRGTTVYFFVNGVLQGTGTISAVGTVGDGAPNYRIGRIGGGPSANYAWYGYVDETRITDGVGRYISDFPVPTGPYPNK